MCERNRAILAFKLFAAGATDDRKRVTASIEQNQRLLAAFERVAGLLYKRPGKKLLTMAGFRPRLLKLAPHVDQFHLGQRAIHHTVLDFDARVLSLHRVLPALERRRRRTQHYHRAGKLGPHHRNIARVVARRLLLLVALVVFLIDENQPQIGRRRKDGRSRTYYNSRLAALDAPPLLAAFLRRKRRVQQRHALPKRRIQQADHLRREADLRNQQDRRQSPI